METTPALEYVVRIFIPESLQDDEVNLFILANKPRGWEVSWTSRDNKKEWPVDGEGFSLVSLYRTYGDQEAIAYLVEENANIKRYLGEVKELAGKIASYWQF